MDPAAPPTDELIRFLLPQAHTRGVIIRGSHIFAEAARVHGLAGPVAELFGQTLLASILLLSISKGGTRQVLQLDATGNAPVRRLLAETARGSVRGYLRWQEDEPVMHSPHGHTLSEWMGRSLKLSTVRDLGFGHPYVSVSEQQADYLADHLVHYLNQSVQIRADIILHGDLAIMIEAMPDCGEERWFEAVRCLAAIPDAALEHEHPADLLARFESLGSRQAGLDHYAYRCGCSEKQMRQVLASIPADELGPLVDERGKVRISCQYCDKYYEIDAPLDAAD